MGGSSMSSGRPADPAPGDPRRTILVGLGNPVLGDDGVGWRVVEVVADRLGEGSPGEGWLGEGSPGVAVARLAVGGLRLMEGLIGFDRAILVDAIQTGSEAVGSVTVRPLRDLPRRLAGHLDSIHDAPLVAALAAGRSLGARLPDEVIVVGIEATFGDTFADRLSPAVERAVSVAADRVLEALAGSAPGPGTAAPA